MEAKMKASELLARRYQEGRTTQELRDRANAVLRSAVVDGFGPMERLLLMAVVARSHKFEDASCSPGRPLSAADLVLDLDVSPARVAVYLGRAFKAGWLRGLREPGRAYNLVVNLGFFLNAPTTFQRGNSPRNRGEGVPSKTKGHKLSSSSKNFLIENIPPAAGDDPPLAGGEGPTGRPIDTIEGLKGIVAKEFSGDGREPQVEEKEPTSREVGLLETYVRARRDFQHDYEPLPGARKQIRIAVGVLDKAKVRPAFWPLYVCWVFRKFAEIKGREVPAPANMLASDWYIEGFTADKVDTTWYRIDSANAKRLLRERGYTGHFMAALDVAKNRLGLGEVHKWPSDAVDAGNWIADNLELVGIVEVQRPSAR
jgi:hypothetical protein